MKQLIKIKDLDCAVCAGELEERLKKTDGVTFASVSYAAQTIVLETVDEGAFGRAKAVISGFEKVEIVLGEPTQKTSGEVSIRLENLHCAACALDLEADLKKIAGVLDAQVSFPTQTAVILAENQAAIKKAVKVCSSFEKVRVLNGDEITQKGLLLEEKLARNATDEV